MALEQVLIHNPSREALSVAARLHFCCPGELIGDIMPHGDLAQRVVSPVVPGIVFNLGARCPALRDGSLQDNTRPESRAANNRKEEAVKKTVCRSFFMVILGLALIACSSPMQPPVNIGEKSQKDFMSALRWKQYQAAASLMQPEFRQEFIATFNAFRDDLHISDVRIVNVQIFEEGRRREAAVEMDYYLLPSVQLKTFRFDQIWLYSEGSDTQPEGFFIVTPFPEFP